ncbi:MAG TPA: FAD-dependent oxidoreductase [Thermohalobaculum sp.]|nr:FAD-dependent oxidoreductase [Thermohalobaculum sp.]
MAELPSTARVVIIGGGAVGCSALYHLGLRGWTDCVLVERNELTSGSTWHAAGNVPTFSASWAIMNMQRYSTELYRGLAEAVDYPMNYHVTGSVRLAHSRERMQEFERVKGMGRYQGMDLEVCSPQELKARYPFLELHGLAGGLYDPHDGDIDPAQLTQALAKGARDKGQRIVRFCPVTGVRREGAEWLVETAQGTIRCEYVVNAAGYRAGEVGRLFGRAVPLVAMEHQYIMFDNVPEVQEWSEAEGRKLPLLRDVDSSYYLRQEKFGFNLGPYERDCRARWASDGDPLPEDFSFQLYPDDLERLEWYLEDAVARVPALGRAGLTKVVNGPIPYAPDGNPLIGPMPGVRQAFEACVFTFGIAQAGGAGKVLAEWLVDGGTEWDMWACDPRRFGPWADLDYTRAKAIEVYGHEYAMHFPRHAWPAGRPRRVSPIHGRVAALGAQFGAYGGWERANWFAQEGDDTSQEATQTWARPGPWEPRIRAECEAVRDAAGVLNLCGFSRFDLDGPGAAEWLDGLITGALPRVGRIGLIYVADARGRVLTEMSCVRHGEDVMTLITAAAAQEHDRELLEGHAPRGAQFGLTDRTEEHDTLILAGPQSRAVLAGVADADLSLPWLTHQPGRIAGRPVHLIRVSFTGELGWEVHAATSDMEAVFDAVWQAGAPHGLKPFGMFALDSLRIEKAYRAWKGDLSTDYSMLEAGLGRFVRLDKAADFPGRDALVREREAGVRKRFAPLIVEAGACDAPYMSTVWHDGEIVGETTSGAWGYRVGASVALAMLRADLARPGTRVEVEIYGERRPAVVQPDRPLWDPLNERLKA